MESLLDFSNPSFDTNLLDNVVNVFYNSTNAIEKKEAQRILEAFSEHENAWTRAPDILERSNLQHSKFVALSALDKVIKYRWMALSPEDQLGIRNYITNKIVVLSSNESSLRSEKLYLDKLNSTLVSIAKQEWPARWETFIIEVVDSSKSNEFLCENNLSILRILSEEIFTYSRGQLTNEKGEELRRTFSAQFTSVFDLCLFILENGNRKSLVKNALEALLRFLTWIPVNYIFETNVINVLIQRYLPEEEFGPTVLRCLTEIAAITTGNASDEELNRAIKLIGMVLERLSSFLPHTCHFNELFEKSDLIAEFISLLAVFLTTFLKTHNHILETANMELARTAHVYLARLSQVDDQELFKICVEYWNRFSESLHQESAGPVIGLYATRKNNRVANYSDILVEVRSAVIIRMAKPDEYLLVENDDGEVIRQNIEDTDEKILYNSMRETLVYLANLDQPNTISIIERYLSEIRTKKSVDRNKLSRVCWAIGSISGVQSDDDEKKLMINILKILLDYCENVRGKDDKAAIAGNIMYCVGQYPRFLRSHWKFMRTVIIKLFEFMKETHPGVQDMACDTFLKIASTCSHHFTITQDDGEIFIETIFNMMEGTTAKLDPKQKATFMKCLGYAIASADQNRQDMLINRAMFKFNENWSTIIYQASRNADFLNNGDVARELTFILRINSAFASSVGGSYLFQIKHIFHQLLNLYTHYSSRISFIIQEKGPEAVKYAEVRHMRSVKRECLNLLRNFVENSQNKELIASEYLPTLFEAVLVDYEKNIPNARDAEVLSLITAFINSLRELITSQIPDIFSFIFEATLTMIQQNFEDYPEHRQNLFLLIQAVNRHCFDAFFLMSSEKFKLIIESIVWCFRHTATKIAETGMETMLDLFSKISNSNIAQAFYSTFLLRIIQDIFQVLTDSFHKSCFKLHATLLSNIFVAVKSGQVQTPLWDSGSFDSNETFLKVYISRLLGNAFPNVASLQIESFAQGLFDCCIVDLNAFKRLLRDFLITSKEFSNLGEKNSELFREERDEEERRLQEQRQAVPGLIRPN